MIKQKIAGFFAFLISCLFFLPFAQAQIDPSSLLPAEEAFVPQVFNSENGLSVNFDVADGYYLYQSKLEFITTPNQLLQAPQFSQGLEKEDEFFGKQLVYYNSAQINLPYQSQYSNPYQLKIVYQGCADVGICYPPTEVMVDINGLGLMTKAAAPKGFDFKSGSSGSERPTNNSIPDKGQFTLSWDTLNANLLAFFLAGLGLSFTACMYPLLPIVSSIVVGDKKNSKSRAFALSMIYVQGLALTYTLVGVIAGLTGALLTVWLQQAWVVLSASALMIILSLGMFGVFTIQLPNRLQAYFQNQSSKLSGGKIASVFVMGMMSALIIGPCVAPPLAFALGYIGTTGDGTLGGLALYALALGTGAPLVIIGTFGAHFLPKAGHWMNGVKYFFGCILLAVAVYLATPFIPYAAALIAYFLIILIPGLYLIYRRFKHQQHWIASILGIALSIFSVYFVTQGLRHETTALHHFLTLIPPSEQQNGHHRLHSTEEINAAIDKAFQQDSNQVVLVDFYADWCVSCKEMEAKTLNQAEVQAVIDMDRFLTIDVTENNPDHQALLKEYGLFGPPGIFVLKADGSRSDPLLGYVPPKTFIQWYQQQVDSKP